LIYLMRIAYVLYAELGWLGAMFVLHVDLEILSHLINIHYPVHVE
jgi:hypothetical protein